MCHHSCAALGDRETRRKDGSGASTLHRRRSCRGGQRVDHRASSKPSDTLDGRRGTGWMLLVCRGLGRSPRGRWPKRLLRKKAEFCSTNVLAAEAGGQQKN